jgi:hypothetical protein
VDQPSRGSEAIEQILRTFDIDFPGHARIKLTMLELAGPFGVEHRRKPIPIEQPAQAVAILNVARLDPNPTEGPIVHSPRTNDLPWITLAKIVESVVTGYAGNTRHQERQGWMRTERSETNHNERGTDLLPDAVRGGASRQ